MLREAVASSQGYRGVYAKLGLRKGPHQHVKRRIVELSLDTTHFVSHPEALLAPDNELRELVITSRSATQVLIGLGIDLHSNHFFKLKRRIRQLGIDTSHFDRKRAIRDGRKTRWTDDELRAAVASSYGIAETIRALGLIPAGGNYIAIPRRIRELELDVSHFRGRGWNVEGKYIKPVARPLSEVLVVGSSMRSHALKLRLIDAGLKKAECEKCGWATARKCDGVIPIELDHINGNPVDNRLENLRVLCPNCHALQPTHRGLNKRKNK